MSLYGLPSDVFYYICDNVNPVDLLPLARTCRLFWFRVGLSEHRNLWFDWWKRNISQFVLPIGTIHEQRKTVYLAARCEPKFDDALAAGYEKIISRWNWSSQDCYLLLDDTIRNGHLHILKTIQTCGHNFQLSAYRLLDIAIKHKQAAIFEWLLQFIGENLKQVLVYGLFDAQLLRILIASGAAVNTGGQYNTTLSRAAQEGNCEIINILLQAGADPNRHNGLALCRAVEWGNIQAMKLLIEHGADISVLTSTHLVNALLYGKVKVVKLMIKLGVDTSLITPDILKQCRPTVAAYLQRYIR